MSARLVWILSLGLFSTAATAAEFVVPMSLVEASGIGKQVGTITATESDYGVIFTPRLAGLTPGLHGFHLHDKPSCGAQEKDGKMVAGLAAGGHFDPDGTNTHAGPWANGHLGDLPALYVGANSSAVYPVLAPRLKLTDLPGHSLMIHVGGDNHADHPEKLGGGGARVACGVIPE
jgi:Cu-Zn family superoxide dismutase